MKFVFAKKHFVLVASEGNFIVDTGSSISFNNKGLREINVDGALLDVSNREYGNDPLGKASRLTGMDIIGFIGLDNILKYGLYVDFEKGVIEFARKEIAGADKINTFVNNFIMTNDISINGHKMKSIIDTGAHISFVFKRYFDASDNTGIRYEDDSPMFGYIEGVLYKAKYNKPGYCGETQTGLVEDVRGLSGVFNKINVGGIFGMSVFENIKYFSIPSNNEIQYK